MHYVTPGRAGELGFTKHDERVRLEASSISRNTACIYVRSPAFAGNRDDVLRKRERIIRSCAASLQFHSRGFPSRSRCPRCLLARSLSLEAEDPNPSRPFFFYPSGFGRRRAAKGPRGTHTFSLFFSLSLFLSLSRVAQWCPCRRDCYVRKKPSRAKSVDNLNYISHHNPRAG